MTPDRGRRDPKDQDQIRQRTDALVARANAIRASVAAAADELAGLTRELRVLLADDDGKRHG